MSKGRGKKRKVRNSSGNGSDLAGNSKQYKQRGPSEELSNSENEDPNASVSDVIGQANAVLFPDSVDSNEAGSSDDSVNRSVFVNTCGGTDKMADDKSGPSNSELKEFMKSISTRLDSIDTINQRLDSIEKKLDKIDLLEQKVSGMEKELNKVWVALEERAKRTDDRVGQLEDRVESSDMGVALLSTRVADLERQREELRNDVTYLTSQSMRNNLIFTNIPEDNSNPGGNETPDVTERKLRQHLHSALKIAKETADSIKFERVHRAPGQPRTDGKIRNIVAKFTFFPDRELVRKQWKHLKGTNFYMFEQFPREVSDKRRGLVKKMKDAKAQGKRAWIVYDTLYIDGKPVRG